MRYYSIKISKPGSTEPIRPFAFRDLKLPDTYSSFINGKSIPGALNVELNIPLYNYANPRQGAFVRVWGVSNEELSQSNDLSGLDIVVKAGMQKGMPLAKTAQAGTIVAGRIFQAYGNMVGIDRTLDMILLPAAGVGGAPLDFSFTWPKDTPMEAMIKTTLDKAMPGYEVKISISDDLRMSSDQTALCDRLDVFATKIWNLSQQKQFLGIKPLDGGAYPGVHMTIQEKTILVYDRTKDYGKSTEKKPIKIAFEDMIGQPTWISPTSINFKCVMRSDIKVGDFIKMPEKINSPYVITVPGSSVPGSPSRIKSAFEGVFVIQYMQHFGNFRQADAASWVTSFDAVFTKFPDQVIEQQNQAKIAAAFNAP